MRQLVPAQLLEEDHPARIVDAVVERLDLEPIYASYKEEGKPAYHPKMMVKVLFYSYLIGVMSSRKMEAGLELRADYVFLSGDQVPDFRTLNGFRTRHREQLPGLFTQIVMLCSAVGMVEFKNLAIDGQKIQAKASFWNTVDRVRKGMERLLEREPKDTMDPATIEEWKKKLERKEKRLTQALATLESLTDAGASVNRVDADAKLRRHKDRRSVPSYTHQSAVDDRYGVTVAVATRQTVDRPEDLFALVDAAETNAGKAFETVLADSGFSDYESLRRMEEDRKETFLVPDKRQEVGDSGQPARGEYDKSKFQANPEGTTMPCPQGKVLLSSVT